MTKATQNRYSVVTGRMSIDEALEEAEDKAYLYYADQDTGGVSYLKGLTVLLVTS